MLLSERARSVMLRASEMFVPSSSGRAPVERVGCQLVALPTRDADPGVDSRTARLEYDEGVDVQLLDVRMLADQPGYALNHVGDRLAVHRRLTPNPAQQFRAADLVCHLMRVDVGQWLHAEHDVAQCLDVDAAESEHEHGAE